MVLMSNGNGFQFGLLDTHKTNCWHCTVQTPWQLRSNWGRDHHGCHGGLDWRPCWAVWCQRVWPQHLPAHLPCPQSWCFCHQCQKGLMFHGLNLVSFFFFCVNKGPVWVTVLLNLTWLIDFCSYYNRVRGNHSVHVSVHLDFVWTISSELFDLL